MATRGDPHGKVRSTLTALLLHWLTAYTINALSKPDSPVVKIWSSTTTAVDTFAEQGGWQAKSSTSGQAINSKAARSTSVPAVHCDARRGCCCKIALIVWRSLLNALLFSKTKTKGRRAHLRASDLCRGHLCASHECILEFLEVYISTPGPRQTTNTSARLHNPCFLCGISCACSAQCSAMW